MQFAERQFPTALDILGRIICPATLFIMSTHTCVVKIPKQQKQEPHIISAKAKMTDTCQNIHVQSPKTQLVLYY